MEKDNVIRTNPVRSTNNNLKENRKNPSSYNYNGNLRNQAGLTYEQALELQKRIAHLENRLKQLENNTKSKIVVAPVKRDTPKPETRTNRHGKVITRPTSAREIQTFRGPAPQVATRVYRDSSRTINKTTSHQAYNRAVEAYSKSVAQSLLVKPAEPEKKAIAVVENDKKPSIWEKIKKAVKSFFADEPETNKKDMQSSFSNSYNNQNSTSWGNNNNYKYNQFRQNVPKTTVQIDPSKKDNTTKKKSEHILDRYA